ncbi:MAG: hydrogenase expression/formation protein HypE, partial [Sutterella wadsworthensis]
KDLDAVVASMAKTCEEAGVAIVTGDTKVVERGHGDGVYIAISGIGEKISEGTISGRAARPGDAVLISGTMGDHGTAILSFREGMSFGTTVESDCAPLNEMVEAVLSAAPHVHVLRDPTRGGLAATLNEIASQSNVGILLEESTVPVRPEVRSACEFLGLDPLYVANEGKMIVIVPEDEADAALAAMRASPYGENAARIGRVTDDSDVPVGMVEMVTLMGGRRTVDWLAGEQLPRIC